MAFCMVFAYQTDTCKNAKCKNARIGQIGRFEFRNKNSAPGVTKYSFGMVNRTLLEHYDRPFSILNAQPKTRRKHRNTGACFYVFVFPTVLSAHYEDRADFDNPDFYSDIGRFTAVAPVQLKSANLCFWFRGWFRDGFAAFTPAKLRNRASARKLRPSSKIDLFAGSHEKLPDSSRLSSRLLSRKHTREVGKLET